MMSEDDFHERVFKKLTAKRERLYPRQEGEREINYEYRVPRNLYDFGYVYDSYKTKIMMDKFKDVMVSYLGYHYVARVPRTIYTSEFNIYETFYNYLLNDFKIYQLPKMIYNPAEKRYIENIPNEFLKQKSELRLKEEIQSIKRLVKKEDRYNYYR